MPDPGRGGHRDPEARMKYRINTKPRSFPHDFHRGVAVADRVTDRGVIHMWKILWTTKKVRKFNASSDRENLLLFDPAGGIL